MIESGKNRSQRYQKELGASLQRLSIGSHSLAPHISSSEEIAAISKGSSDLLRIQLVDSCEQIFPESRPPISSNRVISMLQALEGLAQADGSCEPVGHHEMIQLLGLEDDDLESFESDWDMTSFKADIDGNFHVQLTISNKKGEDRVRSVYVSQGIFDDPENLVLSPYFSGNRIIRVHRSKTGLVQFRNPEFPLAEAIEKRYSN